MSTKSIAVWCAERSGSAKTEYEVHANYWRLSGDADFVRKAGNVSDLLEIGVRVDDPGAVDHIGIFLPFKVLRAEVEDCSRYFADTAIAQGIFNDVLRVTTAGPGGPRCIELSGPSGPLCRVHCFSTNTGSGIARAELDVQDEASGTLLTISRSALAAAAAAAGAAPADAYFRLRVPTSGGGLLTVLRPRDHALQSGYEVIEYIDFRLNEARTLPTTVEARMRGVGTNAAELKLVAFLTAVPILSSIAVSSSQSHKMRVLEHDLWTPYVPGQLPKDMMVYHWKRERGLAPGQTGASRLPGPPIQDFSAFIKMSTRRTGRRTLVLYLVIAFLFGVFGNLCASFIEALPPVLTRVSSAFGNSASAESSGNVKGVE